MPQKWHSATANERTSAQHLFNYKTSIQSKRHLRKDATFIQSDFSKEQRIKNRKDVMQQSIDQLIKKIYLIIYVKSKV